MGGGNRGRNPSPDPECRLDLHPVRTKGRYEVIQDGVGDGLVEGARIAVTPEIQLEALQLDAAPVRDIAEGDGRKVRLSGLGTEAGKFRADALYDIGAIRLRVRKGLQYLCGQGGHGGGDTGLQPGLQRILYPSEYGPNSGRVLY